MHHDARIVYLNIPRCASTSLKEHLERHGFTYDQSGQFERPDGWLAFTVVREPTDRYVSGLIQFWKGEHGNLAEKINVELRALSVYRRPVVHDTHLIPQSAFLDPRIPCDVTLAVGPNLHSQVNDILTHHGVRVDGRKLPTANRSDPKAKRQILSCLTEEHRSYLRGFYAEDHQLYDAATVWLDRRTVYNPESGGIG